MHVTYLSIDSIDEGIGQSQILQLIKKIVKSGIKVKLVSFEKKQVRQDLITELELIGIEWQYFPFDDNFFFGTFKRLRILVKCICNTDVVHARGDIPALAALLSRKAPVLWDIRGMWSEQRIIIESNIIKKIVFRMFILLRRIMLNRVDSITTLSSVHDNYLIDKYGRVPLNRNVISTCVETEKFEIIKNMPKKVNILISGTYNNYYDRESTSTFINEFSKKIENTIIWARPQETSEINIGDLEYSIINATYEQMPQIIADSSFGVAICKNTNGVASLGVMPTKIAEFLACGRPVVISENMGDYDKLLSEYKAGVVLRKGNESEAVDEIIKLISDQKTSANCRKLASDHFDLNMGVKKYISLYTSLLNRR
jgi:glycosyltransferase involved in cell wall biosynthesis